MRLLIAVEARRRSSLANRSQSAVESIGEAVTFDNVLLVATDDGTFVSGTPHVAGAKVLGIIEGEVLDNKVRVFIKKRRKGMRRTIGHRTKFTQVRITDIETKQAKG